MLDELGVSRIINGVGSTTLTGGSKLSPNVLAAIAEASRVYVDMPELHVKAGRYVANLLGVPAAFVTSGAAAGLVYAASACLSKGDRDKINRLPRTEGMANEIIVQSLHRNMYDRNLELAGAKLVEIGDQERTTSEDLERAINPNTAAVIYFVWDPEPGVLPLQDVIAISHRHGVPVITDAAAELPPVENFKKFLSMGSDLVLFSGGKDISGPNDTGLMLGRKDLIEICMGMGPHNYELLDPNMSPYRRTRIFLGRPMKTSKEDILALLTALTEYVKVDHDKRIARFEERVEKMVASLSVLEAMAPKKIWPPYGHPRPLTIPRLELTLRSSSEADALVVALKQNDPPIHVWNIGNKVFVNPQCLEENEDAVVVSSLIRLVARTPSAV